MSETKQAARLVRYLPHLWGPMAGEGYSHLTEAQKMLNEALAMRRPLSFLTLNPDESQRTSGLEKKCLEMSQFASLMDYSENYINVGLL